MKQSAAVIRKWVRLISDDYMHFSAEQEEYVCNLASVCDFYIMPDDSGVVGYIIAQDFDCKKKMNVLLFYCRPESRGRAFIPMLRHCELVARAEGVEKIIIGCSTSGYKEEKFNRILERFGYSNCAYGKRI